jgi:hypothetical protein
MDWNKYKKWIVIAILVLILIYVVRKDQERFALPASLTDGLYMIKNSDKVFTSTAFTPTQCNNFAFSKAQPSMEDSWVLKKVSNGVFMLQKPGGKECLYTHIDGSLKSYLIADCDRKNLCGSEELDSNGELDRYSIRSYFKLSNGPNGKIVMQSMQNNQYVCMDNGVASFKTTTDESCMFDFQKL